MGFSNQRWQGHGIQNISRRIIHMKADVKTRLKRFNDCDAGSLKESEAPEFTLTLLEYERDLTIKVISGVKVLAV